jgi:hypothetical protein
VECWYARGGAAGRGGGSLSHLPQCGSAAQRRLVPKRARQRSSSCFTPRLVMATQCGPDEREQDPDDGPSRIPSVAQRKGQCGSTGRAEHEPADRDEPSLRSISPLSESALDVRLRLSPRCAHRASGRHSSYSHRRCQSVLTEVDALLSSGIARAIPLMSMAIPNTFGLTRRISIRGQNSRAGHGQ